MAITLADFTKIWASTSPLTPYSFSDANYQEGWNFVGSTPPARQMWDFLQKNNDEKMKYIVDNYTTLDDIFYKAGDTQSIGTVLVAGDVTNGAKDMRFSFVLPKRMDNITTITIDSWTGGIRVPAGGYIKTDGTDLKTAFTCTAFKASENMVTIFATSGSAISGATNNTPLACWCNLTVSFS